MSLSLDSDLEKIFLKISKLKDKIIVFQTDVLNTSIFYKTEPKKVAKKIIFLIEKIFRNKTILFPAFSNDIVYKKKFDILRSSINTGLIPKLILKRNYYRTFSPLHSFLVKGPGIKEIKKLNQITTWGEGSVFEWLEKKNARWVAFNLNWERGCAFAHRSEELCKVPYRFYKTFYGKMYKNGKFIKNISEKKYSNYKSIKLIKDNISAYKSLEKRDSTTFFVNKGLFVKTACTKDITRHNCIFLKKNSLGRIKNKKKVLIWLRKKNKI